MYHNNSARSHKTNRSLHSLGLTIKERDVRVQACSEGKFGCMAVYLCACGARVCVYREYKKTIHFSIYLQVLMTFPFFT